MSSEPRIIGDTRPRPEPPAGSAGGDEPGTAPPAEIGGRDGPDPTRYGDWEKNGRCIDF
ncbi:MAG: DUF1674 domain-containing protein [Pseudomonadota bacterium]